MAVHISSKLPRSYTDFIFAATAGLLSGASRLSFVGHNLDIDTGTTPETVWEAGGLYPWLAAASSLEVLSSSANDAAAGTGMRTARVIGLDSAFAVQQEDVILNGVTPRALTKQYYRINRFYGLTAGSLGFNDGNITLRVSGGGAIQSFIEINEGLAHNGVQTVPAGFTLFVYDVFGALLLASGTSDAARLALRIRDASNATPCWTQLIQFALMTQATSTHEIVSVMPYPVPEKNDFEPIVQTVSVNNMAATVLVQGVLVDNSKINFY